MPQYAMQPDPHKPRIVYVQPRQPKQKWHFRWWPWLILLIALLLWKLIPMLGTVRFSWSSVMDLLNIHDRGRYTSLAILGCVIVAMVAVVRILCGPRKNDDV